MCIADRDYLKAMLLPTDSVAEREVLQRSAIENYGKTLTLWEVLMLRHYVNDAIVANMFPRGITRGNLESIPPPLLNGLTFNISKFLETHPEMDTESDRHEAERYYRRAYQRLVQLKVPPPIQ